jgi:hypothetical protein
MIQRELPDAEKRMAQQRSIPGAEYNTALRGFIELSNHLSVTEEPVCN